MQSMPGSKHHMSQESSPLTPCALWSVDLKLTHLDWKPEATLIHFQGQYLTICELDYTILQGEIQNVPKSKAAVEIGEFCLVEDSSVARWFRGRVQNQKDDLFDVFLIDRGNILSVDVAHMSSCSSDLFNLPPKIVCGFLANVLLLQNVSYSTVEKYFSSLIGKNVTGFIQAVLPHKVLLLEAPDINCDLVRHGFGRPVDTDTFILLVSMLTDVPLKQNIEPVPDLLIEKPRVQGFCFRSSSLQGYTDVLSFCGPRLACETRAKVRVTAGVNPGLFFCRMVSVEAELHEMSKRLAAIFEHRTEEYNQKTPENLGLLCAVKGKDEKWVRGFLQFLPVNSQVRVFFIDYGLFELVKVENVHRLPPEFYSAPVMALPCTLPSSTGQDVALKAQQLSFLKAGLLGAVLDVEIRDFDVEQYLYTITVLGADEPHVAEPEPIHHGPFEPDVKETSPPSGFPNFKTMLSEAFYKTLQEEEVQVGLVFEGYVEHAQNPNHFWIRTQKRNEEFEEMMSEITNHFSQVKLDEDLLLNPELGAMCCAGYEKDLHFYRGVVTDVLKHGAEIFFIDFGNTEKVPYTLIKNMPETVANKSAFAMCCTLANVFPLDDVWASTTCDFFRKSVLNKPFLVHVVRMKKYQCVVELFEMGNDISITELLIASKLAEYIPVEPAARNSKDGTEETKHLHHPVTADVGGRSEQRENYREEEKMFKNEAEVKGSFRAVSIKPGFEFSVRCSDISSPSDFWCQPLDKLPALDKLMDDMQHYYSLHTAALQPGESCCVAKSPHDGKWYRGFIVGKQKGHTSVMLVDFGPVIQVRQNHLQAIIPDYMYLEGQAIRCSLYNLIEPAEHTQCGDWSPEVLNLLKHFVLKSANYLRCQVVSRVNVKNKGLSNVVDLYNSQTQQSVTDALREQGLVRRAEVPMRQRSDVVPDSFVYSSFGVGPGSEEQVYVVHVGSQCEIYCQLERNTEIIEELQMKISEESERMMKANARAAVGNLCLAKYLDGKWYRGLMLPVPLPLHFDVFFVDYGNTKISEKTKVMFIPRSCEDLLFTPMQALRCHLDSVPEEELYVDAKTWLNDTVLNKCVRAVVRAKREDGSFDIELFDGDMNINKKVKELILSQSQKPKTVSLIKNRHKVKNTTFHKRFTKTRDNGKSPSRGQASASTSNGHRLKNYQNVAHWRFHNKSTSVKQQNVINRRRRPQTESKVKPAEHQTVKSKKPQQSKETKPSQLLCFSEKSIRPGFRTKCFVSHVDSISSFFLQLSDDEPDILKMGEELNLGVFKDSLKTAASFQVGDVVLAVFEEDGALYRSVIKTQESNSSFKVEFVDYGNSAYVWREKMYPLPEDYLSQPRFSIPCSLLDSSLYETDSSFTDAVAERPIMVDFVHQSGIQWQVKVEVVDETPENSLTENKASLLSVVKSSEETPSCEQNITDEGQQNEVAKKTSTSGGEDSMPVELSVKHKVKTIKGRRRRGIRRSHKTTKLSSAKVKDSSLPPTIKPGDTGNGTVLSVQRDGFYIRLSKNDDLLTALEEQIKNKMNQFKTVGEANVKRGLRCLVQVQEDTWGRAVVQQVNEGEFKVFLVDYGVTKDIPIVPVLEQCADLMEFPNLAVLCRMKSSRFTEEEEADQGWYETLEPMIGSEVKLIFVSFYEADDSWMVEIVMDELFLLWQIKASRQLIVDRSASPADTQSEGGPTSNMDAPQQLGFVPVENNKVYSGFAAAVTTPSDFCVVLEDLLLTRSKVSAILDDLPPEMPPLPEAHLVPGTCCLLKPESRSRWCRAEIIHADATVVLDLVDHGHYECIASHDLSKLKKLPVELMDLPKLTYPCTLKGVKPAGGDGQWSDEAAVFFQRCLDQKNLQIFFREFVSNSDWNVDIVVDGVHVANKLVDTGHANYTDVAPELRFQATGLPPGPGNEEEEGSAGPDGKQTFNAESTSNHCFLM